MQITSTGDVDIMGSATVNGGVAVTSDKRLKSNINDLQIGLNEVLAFRPVTFNYNGKAGTDSTRTYMGLVAQELQEVTPLLVSDHSITNYDTDGDIKGEEVYLKVHDSELKYVLIKAIQEQQKIIETQRDQIKDLENRLAVLEKKR